MEEPRSPQSKAFGPWAFAAFAAAVALILALALPHTAPAGPQQLRLPPAVTGHACMTVAKQAHLVSHKMSSATLGAYYAAWVKHLANGHSFTRSTLFDAGLAVSVCVKAQ